MELSELMKGYKGMCEFIKELDISDCTNSERLSGYKNIKTALGFVSSDVFGNLCQHNENEICKQYYSTKVIDETYKNCHDMSWVSTSMVTNIPYTAIHWEPSNDVYTDIHRIYTDGVSEKDAREIDKHCDKPIYHDKYMKYMGACIIYKAMFKTAKEILDLVSHKKVRVDIHLSALYNLGKFTSVEEARKQYGDDVTVDMLKDKERLSSEMEFIKREIDEYMTRDEIEAEWGESFDVLDVHQEFEDNIKLGIFREMFSPEAYNKVLEMNNYKFIKKDNDGKIVCHPPYTD